MPARKMPLNPDKRFPGDMYSHFDNFKKDFGCFQIIVINEQYCKIHDINFKIDTISASLRNDFITYIISKIVNNIQDKAGKRSIGVKIGNAKLYICQLGDKVDGQTFEYLIRVSKLELGDPGYLPEREIPEIVQPSEPAVEEPADVLD
jgi:hypothetical protein